MLIKETTAKASGGICKLMLQEVYDGRWVVAFFADTEADGEDSKVTYFDNMIDALEAFYELEVEIVKCEYLFGKEEPEDE